MALRAETRLSSSRDRRDLRSCWRLRRRSCENPPDFLHNCGGRHLARPAGGSAGNFTRRREIFSTRRQTVV